MATTTTSRPSLDGQDNPSSPLASRARTQTDIAMSPSSPLSSAPASLPSSPLSLLSQSPPPPSPPLLSTEPPEKRYPSPSASSPSGTQSPVKCQYADDHPSSHNLHRRGRCDDLAAGEVPPSEDGPPPPKKRKVTAPKPRTTEYLDLRDVPHNVDDKSNPHALLLARLLGALRKKKKIVVIAGAGISVSAGIPDFRSSSGLFATLKTRHNLKGSGKHLFDAAVYRHDSSTQSFHTMVRELAQLTATAAPTPFHHFLASLATEGRLMRLYTQNVDCLDTNMEPLATTIPLNPKGPWPLTIQLHGGLEKMVCTKCGHLETFQPLLFDGPQAPLCERCKEQELVRLHFANKRSQGIGRLRPRIVLYNESNPDEEAIGTVSMADLRSRPDAVIVVGTSLKIPGVRRLVKELCQVTRSRRDGFTAWINLDAEPQGAEFRECWDLVVRGKCDDVAELVNLPRWNERGALDAGAVLSDEDEKLRQEMLRNRKVEVQISPRNPKTTAIKSENTEPAPFSGPGILTPGASPLLSGISDVPEGYPSHKTKQGKLAFGAIKKNTISDDDPQGLLRVFKAPKKQKPTKASISKQGSKLSGGPGPKQQKKSVANVPFAGTVTNAFRPVKNSTSVGTPGSDKTKRRPLPDSRSPPSKSTAPTAALPLPALRPTRPESKLLQFQCETGPFPDNAESPTTDPPTLEISTGLHESPSTA